MKTITIFAAKDAKSSIGADLELEITPENPSELPDTADIVSFLPGHKLGFILRKPEKISDSTYSMKIRSVAYMGDLGSIKKGDRIMVYKRTMDNEWRFLRFYSHLKIAWEEWINSQEGRGCMGNFSGQLPDDQIKYLYNRLWWAFHAGYWSREIKTQQ